MNSESRNYFEQLKKALSLEFRKNYAVNSDIEDWKGEEIVLFQEDLFKKTKARVSEKWFYTYFKNPTEKLPRIDMLNLLSLYIGYDSWNSFKRKHKVKHANSKFNWIIAVTIFAGIVITILSSINKRTNFQFCFVSEFNNKRITQLQLDIKILIKDESPIFLKADSSGCFSFQTDKDIITFVVQSPYHKTDTIIRHKRSSTNDEIQLATDDYSLMLDFYLSGNIKDWTKHKNKLSDIIDENAVIYQYYSQDIGIELFTKEEFIRFLSIPTSNLQKISIIDKEFKKGKIVKLKFIVK